MKKIALVLALSVGLAGCAQLQAIGTGVSIATASIANPVTTDRLFEIEASVRIAITALQTYKRACVAGAADKMCRANIAAVQPYTRQIGPLLIQLRSFVKNNDQVNAVVVFNQVTTLYTNLKAAASSVGVDLGS